MYDYIIVGAGPTGLTLAWLLAKYNKKIVVIERGSSIGGCHRVRRIPNAVMTEESHRVRRIPNAVMTEESHRVRRIPKTKGYFTEHGPRVYENSYRNFIALLKDMNLDFYDLFVPYKVSNEQANRETISNFTPREFAILALQFFKLIFNPRAGEKTTVYDFMTKHNFSKKAIDYSDRLCRLTDGASSLRYTMLEFIQLFNQRVFYKIYQPKQANDRALLKEWRKALESTGNVSILTDTNVQRLTIKGDLISTVETNRGSFQGRNVLAAIPPVHLEQLLQRSQLNAYNKDFHQWVQATKYITYIPVTFHWYNEQKIPVKWGFGSTSDWGIVWINLSDYFDPSEPLSKILISSCVTKPNHRSKRTGKTANESTKEEIILETWNQLHESFPELPPPNKIILSPELSKGDIWYSTEQAFVLTPSGFKPAQSPIYKNLYSVGTHNGHSPIEFTSMESAVSNAIDLVNKLENKNIPIRSPLALTNIIQMILFFLFVFFLYKVSTKL